MSFFGEKRRNYQNNLYKERRKIWLQENGPCCECGSSEELQVDHIIPRNKSKALKAARIWTLGLQRRNQELSHCQVLCKSCHKIKSSKENADFFRGKPKLKYRVIPDECFIQVKQLVANGMTEREACVLVGICRGTYSSHKIRGYR